MSEAMSMQSSSVGLVAPAALFLALFLVLPVGFLLASSLLTQTDSGHIGWPSGIGPLCGPGHQRNVHAVTPV
jgi:hypothetical protein